jgi:archaellum component FlaD/FlaE
MMDGLFGGDDDESETVEGDDGDGDPLLDEDGLGDEEMILDDVDGEAGDAGTGELENRMDELENEVGSLSSTVNTVKSENEQIRESVDDVEENVRKLLEVYEMVTRGVNPFVNEDELGDGFGAEGDDSVGLFGDDDGEELAEEIDDADADDFVDGDDGAFEELGEDEDLDGEDEAAEGTSFEELKDEYESGADWGEEDPTDDDPDGGPPSDDDPVVTEDDAGGASDGTGESSAADEDDGRGPHLTALPAGYAADVLVMEWLEFLVDRAGVDGAARSIAYYESVGWLSRDAAADLGAFLQGFGESVDPPAAVEPRSPLGVGSHRTSLRYVSRLAGSSVDMDVLDRLEEGLARRPGRRDDRAPPVAGAALDAGSGEAPPEPGLHSVGGRTPDEPSREPTLPNPPVAGGDPRPPGEGSPSGGGDPVAVDAPAEDTHGGDAGGADGEHDDHGGD